MKSLSQRCDSSPSGISRSRSPLPTIRSTPWLKVDLRLLEVYQLGYPQTGGVEQLEHRAIAMAQRLIRIRCIQQRIDLFL